MWQQYCVVLGEEQNIEPSQTGQNHIDESQVLDHKNAQRKPTDVTNGFVSSPGHKKTVRTALHGMCCCVFFNL